ncbi:MAG: NAD-dependent epimerase/dehydratase family protein [Opitutaceae bacterium]|nr:NAD-dependent epimerase/dehydratase family protein [Opitutaceae bacterium]
MRTEQSAQRTYLVTGVAGFIASKVAELLLAEGHTVVGVDNLNDYYDVRLKDYRLGKLLGAGSRELGADPKKSVFAGVGRVLRNAPNQSGALGTTRPTFEFHHLDIENLPALEAVFAAHKFDAVFNLAARAGVRASLEHPELYRRTNVLGEENVLKCQVKHGVKKHVLASSSSVYAGCPMPFTEDAKLGPGQSPYAETKRAAELLAKEAHDRHALDVTVLRYFTVFGPAGRPDMAPFRFIKWIEEGTPITLYGDGSQSRDFTYVDDIARGTVLAGKLFGSQLSTLNPQLRSPVAPTYDIINLGGGRNPISLQVVIAFIEKALGKKAIIDGKPFHVADIKETWADISKAERLLGWTPQISPEQGFQYSVDWHIANRGWLKDIKL